MCYSCKLSVSLTRACWHRVFTNIFPQEELGQDVTARLQAIGLVDNGQGMSGVTLRICSETQAFCCATNIDDEHLALR